MTTDLLCGNESCYEEKRKKTIIAMCVTFKDFFIENKNSLFIV